MKQLCVCSFILFLIPLVSNAQSKEIYVNPDFATLSQNHKTLAIIPFTASVKLRPKQMKNMTPEQHLELEKDEGLAVQSALHTYFLKKKEKFDFTVSFQDISRTNVLLAKNNVDDEQMALLTSEELAGILGVDGVITGRLTTDKPMSDGASAAWVLPLDFTAARTRGSVRLISMMG